MSSPPQSRAAASSTPKARYPDRSPSRTGIPTSTGQGLGRNPSLRSTRPIRKTPVRASISNDGGAEEDAKAANAQVISDLKDQVERAEQASEQYRRQLDAMQRRLDQVANETTAAEEREFQSRTQIDKLQAELRDNTRRSRELGMSFDSEKKILLQDRERYTTKEAELQSVVNRLTDSLKSKNQELNNTSRIDSSGGRPSLDKHVDDGGMTDHQDYFQILRNKDNIIENLRLEIADFHVRMAEREHIGDAGSQALEKEILDVKLRNARLQEENESFQVLLSEKTLKGDFMHDQSSSGIITSSSLAEELESVSESDITPEAYRALELETKGLRESNKALTLYVDKIIGRLLQHDGFEHIITDKDDMPRVPAKDEPVQKALPEVPTEKPQPTPPFDAMKSAAISTPVATAASAAAGFLQRARSVVARPATSKARPMSFMAQGASANENPQTAPSIPIARGHRRARSDQAQDLGPASAITQMNRGSPLRAASGGPLSPGISPLSTISNQRGSYFGPSRDSVTRIPSESVGMNKRDSSSNSIVSDHSLEVERESTDASSVRASLYGAAGTGLPGAVMKQNQLRPLRLVQEQAQADEDAQKKANRGSWMGWFKPGSVETANE